MNQSDSVISLDLPADFILEAALAAHEQDITLNAYFVKVIEAAIQKWEADDRKWVIERDQWQNRTHGI